MLSKCLICINKLGVFGFSTKLRFIAHQQYNGVCCSNVCFVTSRYRLVCEDHPIKGMRQSNDCFVKHRKQGRKERSLVGDSRYVGSYLRE